MPPPAAPAGHRTAPGASPQLRTGVSDGTGSRRCRPERPPRADATLRAPASRFATFAQAMSSRMPAIVTSTRIGFSTNSRRPSDPHAAGSRAALRKRSRSGPARHPLLLRLPHELLKHDVRRRERLRLRDAGFQPPDQPHPHPRAVIVEELRPVEADNRKREGDVDAHLRIETVETRRGDADDFSRAPVDGDRAPDGTWTAAEHTRPGTRR